jgi:hypothetical protein
MNGDTYDNPITDVGEAIQRLRSGTMGDWLAYYPGRLRGLCGYDGFQGQALIGMRDAFWCEHTVAMFAMASVLAELQGEKDETSAD